MADIKITEAEKEHLKKAVDNMFDAGVEFAESNRNFVRWMTTSTFAVLGFYLTILFQIKSKMDIPLPKVAAASFALLLIGILTGIYARFRFEVKDWFGKMTEIMHSSFNFLQFAINKNPTEAFSPEIIRSANQSLEEVKKKISDAETILSKIQLVRIMLIQVISLSLGTCAVSCYIFYYLFIFNVPLK